MLPLPPRLSGDDARPLPMILAELHRAGATGALAVLGGEKSRELLFTDGELRAARSSAENEKLGSWLVAHGVITEEQLGVALLGQSGSDSPPLGHLLVRRGLVKEEVLERELESLALALLQTATAEPRQAIFFIAEGYRRQPDTLPNLTTSQLIAISARAVRDREALQAAVGDLSRLLRLATRPEAIVAEAQLTPREEELLNRFRDPRSAEEVREQLGMPTTELLEALFTLLAVGALVEVSRPSPPARVQAASPPGTGPRVDVPAASPVPPDDEREAVLRLAGRIADAGHYDVLGLSPSCTYQAIQDSWKVLRERFSPERANESHLADLGPQLRLIHERVEEAYETLIDPFTRGVYNRILRATTTPSSVTGGRPSASAGSTVSTVSTVSSTPSRPEQARALVAQAEQCVRGSDLFTACQLLQRACDLDPQPVNLVSLARLMVKNPKWADRAMQQLQRAVEIDPGCVDAWVEVAEYWRRRGHRERQRKALERALAASPSHPRASELYAALAGADELARLRERMR
jgi:hypothetical protein